MLSNIK